MEPAGERLKKIRLEKGISLEDVQKNTRIHLGILKAIEGDSLTNLSPVYLKGFLKIYCKFLGVDPNEYIPDYKEPSYQLSRPPVRQAGLPAGQAGKPETQPTEKLSSFKTPPISLPRLRLNKKIMAIFASIIAFVIVWMLLSSLVRFIALKFKSGQGRQAKPLALTRRQNNKIPPAPKPQAAQTITQKEVISGIHLGIRAHENCWVSLKADGRLIFQRVLQKGRFESWEAKNKFELSLGNAGVVDLEVNGQLFTNLGRKRQALKNILITKEGLKTGK